TDYFGGSPLWVAQYTYDPYKIPLPIRGFKNPPVLFQYSDRGAVPGIMGDTDLDALFGGIDSIRNPNAV
ncbi:MAG: hypothetical protein ACREQ5_16020, partial [Candidatus Dormibacteria bacterium]